MEYLWNPATALKEIRDGQVNIDKRLLPVDELNSVVYPSFLFSHGSKYMSVVFLGASWKIEFPVRLKVQTGAKLYRQLIENGEGSWEIGEISSTTKVANLMISRLFWYPPTIESVAFIQNVASYHKSDRDDDLGGVPVASHAAYKTLDFHRRFSSFEIND